MEDYRDAKDAALTSQKAYDRTQSLANAARLGGERAVAANDKQVGGAHYAAGYQHWDWVGDCTLEYLIGNASKYVVRAFTKDDPEENFRKAIHYIEKYSEVPRPERGTDSFHIGMVTYRLAQANSLTFAQTKIVYALATYSINEARMLIEEELINLHGRPIAGR